MSLNPSHEFNWKRITMEIKINICMYLYNICIYGSKKEVWFSQPQ